MPAPKPPLVIAVSGLNRGENPQPGGAVIASIRAHIEDVRFVGISYDSMETGIYTQGADRVDATYLFPYPGAGKAAFMARIREVHEREGLSLILPTLDSELENLIALRGELKKMGIEVLVPPAMAFARRAKARLAELGAKADVAVPQTFAVHDVVTAAQSAMQIGYPCYIKGQLYEAHLVTTEVQLVAAFEKVVTTWGAPVLVQEAVFGEEYDIAAVAQDGELIGSITLRKLLRSKMGKGFGGVVVDNPELSEVTRRLLKELAWDGPLEIEVVKPASGPCVLFEINPRFPAWISFGAKVGVNLPAYSVAHALGLTPPALSECPPGKMFLRHCDDIVADISQLADLGIDRELTDLALPCSPKDGAVNG